jgi:outer membrane usher protein
MLTANKVPQTNIVQRGLSLAGKPAFAGGNVSVTTRDANGRNNTFTQPLVPKLTRAETGCNQYSMSVGRARHDYALASNNYGPWFANTTVTCGTDLGLAIEAHGEYLQGENGKGENGLAGINLTQPIGVLGTAAFAVATSDNDKGSGWLVRMGLQHTTDKFEFNVRTRRQSPEFRELGEALDVGSISQRTLASVGAKLSERNLFALAYTNQTSHEGQRTDYVGMSQVIELGHRGKFSIAANRAINETEDASVNVSYLRKWKK